jgi:hypothetical protein
MNIFWLDCDPTQAARWNCDTHVSKIQLEIGQLLSTALREYGVDADIYQSTHTEHPLTQWCAESRQHWLAAFEHCRALADEFEYRRFNAPHNSWVMLRDTAWRYRRQLPDDGWRDPPLCMPDDVANDDLVESYRDYYREYKADIATWTRRDPPPWW